MNKLNHPFHLVTSSPWPIFSSINIMVMLIGTVNWMHFKEKFVMMTGFIALTVTLIQWWRDVIREGTFQGMHTKPVLKGLRLGMILFIISEVFFFISFFWAYFHSSLSPEIEIGNQWPPQGIQPFNPYDIPLLNTIILITSGLFITWSHHSIISSDLKESINSLSITIILGIYFTFLQLIEYITASFTISDSIYGSTFFLSTGFHGLHVIIGTIFLIICAIRLNNNHFSSTHHFGFEGATWYWHFVDVVWLFLYINIYWWTY